MDDVTPVPSDPRPGSWRLYVDVLETVSNAILALAVWGGIAVLVAAFVAQVAGTWVFLLAPAVGLLGAGLSVRVRALRAWETGRTAATPAADA